MISNIPEMTKRITESIKKTLAYLKEAKLPPYKKKKRKDRGKFIQDFFFYKKKMK